MIYFLVHCKEAWTFTTYLDSWGRRLASRVVPLFYEDLARRRRLPRGTYVFSDLERMSPARVELAAAVHEQLRAAGVRTLNDPRRSLRRYDLLRTLHERGTNRFDVYRIERGETPSRFPVFVRRESDHCGSISPLLQGNAELTQTVDELKRAGRATDLIAVEFCDTTAGTGRYRKYSVFRIGDALVPRHVLFSNAWVTKQADLIDDAMAREELQFLRDNPHADVLRRVFDLAGIEYGRVDYGLLNGQVQVWEINTNPTVMVAPDECAPIRKPGQALTASRIEQAFRAIDDNCAGKAIPIRIGKDLAQRSSADLRERAWLSSADLRRAVGHELFVRKTARGLLMSVRDLLHGRPACASEAAASSTQQ